MQDGVSENEAITIFGRDHENIRLSYDDRDLLFVENAKNHTLDTMRDAGWENILKKIKINRRRPPTAADFINNFMVIGGASQIANEVRKFWTYVAILKKYQIRKYTLKYVKNMWD